MRKIILFALCVVLSFFVAGPANAITLGLDDLIGWVHPGTPSNLLDEAVRANQIITLYNAGTSSATIPDPPFTYTYTVYTGSEQGANVPDPILPGVGSGVDLDLGSPTPAAAYDYVLAKLGEDDYLYWLGGNMTAISIGYPTDPGTGLSHLTLFNPTSVPEPTTLLLLGAGLAGIFTFRRFKKG